MSAMGKPQNRADSPRTSRPNERKSSAVGTGSGIIECQSSITDQTDNDKAEILAPGGSSFLGTLAAAATRLSYANASCHSQQGPGHRPGEINPKGLKMAADYRGGRGAGRDNRPTAD